MEQCHALRRHPGHSRWPLAIPPIPPRFNPFNSKIELKGILMTESGPGLHPPAVWEWEPRPNGGKFANISAPSQARTPRMKELPVGEHTLISF